MRIIGLMSGTSADGIDAALCEIDGVPPDLHVRIVATGAWPWSSELRVRILRCYDPVRSSVDEICRINTEIGEAFAYATMQLIEEAKLTPADIDLIASHGQTVWHEVLPNGSVHSTLQIGNSAVIAERTGITVIDDLRSRDIAAGGQGAPLAGYVDWLLLRDPVKARAIQNIGGIGNVTFLPPLSDTTSQPIAFDTGPGNSLIDDVLRIGTDGQQTYDRDGVLARQGTVDTEWLHQLLEHPYYQRIPPKTTGRELFGSIMATELLTAGKRRGLELPDIVATMTALTAHSIADAYARFAPYPIDEIILGGGGRHNPVLVEMLRELVAPAVVLTQEDIGENSDFKETLLCAVIGYETWFARPGNHPAITGAQHPVVLGRIVPGANFVDLIQRTWCRS